MRKGDQNSGGRDTQNKLALEYFDFLAKSFPVMCASDEFDFLPRVETASKYYDRLESLAPDVINECALNLRKFRQKFDSLSICEDNFEKLIDLELLKASTARLLTELKTAESWRHNPLLYLKIAFIGLDHALTKPAAQQEEQQERMLARLRAIPELLQQGVENIDSAPSAYRQAALAMVNDADSYLSEITRDIIGRNCVNAWEPLQKVRSALVKFGKFLHTVPLIEKPRIRLSALEATVKKHFLLERSLSEVFEIAREEWHQDLEQLNKLRAHIDPAKSWRQLYHVYHPSDTEKMDTISLYQDQIESLTGFFGEHGFREIHFNSSLKVCKTPTYLRSVRGSASFSAALTANGGEKDLFYITTCRPRDRGKEAENFLKRRLHREYKFLAAHETVPGHHLLDSVRRKLKNPVRRQIESPLFYEGWACYAETLLKEYGYVDSPIESLVDYKRRLWRAARCQIDVGLATGKLDTEDSIRLLVTTGFTPEEAKNQINRFRLNPGYQLCYTIGRYEIMRLRQTYGSRSGRDQFHKELLEGGELPFHLIEKRFEMLNPSNIKKEKMYHFSLLKILSHTGNPV